MNDTQNPNCQEEVIYKKREMDISHDTIIGVGDDVPPRNRNRTTPMDVVLAAFLLFLIFYGFFALTNPQTYPILGKITPLGKLDPLIGLIMFVVGVYILFKR
ncbi:MAG: hypothetical protein FIB07_13490 [Candidatus Methanoperedens sp.]|nr:hypothetical protein [Candidatus Methanoperedens sp.]